MTLVSAPAGSGKSTLLADWAVNDERQVAWISLDDSDDDAGRLLGTIVAALRNSGAIGDEIAFDSAAARARQMREIVLTELLNSLSSRRQPVSLILDDYHVISSPEAHEIVQFIADRLPPQLHLVIASRVDPPLALSRLRGRNLLLELRAHDLRFSEAEAAEFLGTSMGISLTKEQVAALEQRTEGWAAGLQMAALSLRRHSAPEQFIRGFSGSNRYIVDYLSDEVLSVQPEELRSFVLQTSILDRLNPAVCNAVTGRSDSADILRQLESANMFLIPLDDERFWYRYHHLFATVLQHQLERGGATVSVPELHRRASAWYAGNGMPGEALRHSLSGNDIDQAMEIVSQNALPRTLAGEPATVVRWIEQLPQARVENDLELLLVQAVALIAEFQRDRAAEVVARLERLITPATTPYDLGRYLAVSGTVARSAQEDARARAELGRAVELLPEDSFWSALAALNLGMSHVASVDLVGAVRHFQPVRRQHDRPETLIMAVLAQNYSAQCSLWLGHPDEAMRLAEESLAWMPAFEARAGGPVPFAAFPHAVLGDVYTEWNELEAALEHATRALDYGRRGFAVAFFEASRSLARYAEAAGDWDLAIESLSDARVMILPAWRRGMHALMQRIVLRRGILTGSPADVASVGSWIESEGLLRFREAWPKALAPEFYADYGFITTARWLIEKERLSDASDLLEILLGFSRSTQRTLTTIDLLVLLALSQARSGEESAAVQTMVEALTLASGPRFVTVFAREGATILPIVQRAAPRVADAAFTGSVLTVLGASAVSTRTRGGAPDALSSREREVLKLLSTGASNQEIGRRLFISPATVKKHLENIYGKLGVGGRGQAVARARELGFL